MTTTSSGDKPLLEVVDGLQQQKQQQQQQQQYHHHRQQQQFVGIDFFIES